MLFLIILSITDLVVCSLRGQTNLAGLDRFGKQFVLERKILLDLCRTSLQPKVASEENVKIKRIVGIFVFTNQAMKK